MNKNRFLYFLMRFMMASALFGVCKVNYDILRRICWRMNYSRGMRYYLVFLTRCYMGCLRDFTEEARRFTEFYSSLFKSRRVFTE